MYIYRMWWLPQGPRCKYLPDVENDNLEDLIKQLSTKESLQNIDEGYSAVIAKFQINPINGVASTINVLDF